jgi:ribosome biogenesis GTPase A
LKSVDTVIEVCDARIPVSGRNPIIDELVAGKERVLVLNKSDLADERATEAWLDYYRRNAMAGLRTVLALNSLKVSAIHPLFKKLETIEDGLNRKRAQRSEAARDAERNATGSALAKTGQNTPAAAATARDAERNATGSALTKTGPNTAANAATARAPGPKRRKPLRIMVVGVPNSGKSSLINRLVGRKSAATGDRPGVTRGKQWLTLTNGMQLLDTPGILWPKFEDPEVGLHLAFCGSIRDEIMDTVDLSLELIRVLVRLYPDLLAARFRLEPGDMCAEDDSSASRGDFGEDREGDGDEDQDGAPTDEYDDFGYVPEADMVVALKILKRVARLRGFMLPRGKLDLSRAAGIVLDEFRSSKIGRITLEHPPGATTE